MMKLMGIAIGIMVWGMVATAQGEDCPGTPWGNSGGKTCRDLGMDSRRGTCFPGDRYETLCDDKKNMVKTCPGPKRCQEDWGRRHESDDRYRDDRYRDDHYRDDHGERWQERTW